jgi:hypothetical protein
MEQCSAAYTGAAAAVKITPNTNIVRINKLLPDILEDACTSTDA